MHTTDAKLIHLLKSITGIELCLPQPFYFRTYIRLSLIAIFSSSSYSPIYSSRQSTHVKAGLPWFVFPCSGSQRIVPPNPSLQARKLARSAIEVSQMLGTESRHHSCITPSSCCLNVLSLSKIRSTFYCFRE